MKRTLKLEHPIMVNNESVAELIYDSDEITSVLFAEAEARCRSAAGRNIAITPAVEFDFSLHLYLGFAAILAVNPQLDFADVERIKGRDIVEVMRAGRNFILKSEKSKESSSDAPSETTAEPFTSASETSNEGE